MKDDIAQIGTVRFCVDDWRPSEYNNSTDCTFKLYGDECNEAITIENYYLCCKQFAAALGFTEKTIDEWFGRY